VNIIVAFINLLILCLFYNVKFKGNVGYYKNFFKNDWVI
jgi:hypothetical protein